MRSISLALLAAAFVSCATLPMDGAGPGSMDADAPAADDGSAGEAGSLAEPAAPAAPPIEAARPAPVPSAPASERQVVYSAALRLVVVSAREAFASIQSFAKESGGWL